MERHRYFDPAPSDGLISLAFQHARRASEPNVEEKVLGVTGVPNTEVRIRLGWWRNADGGFAQVIGHDLGADRRYIACRTPMGYLWCPFDGLESSSPTVVTR
jgi:hypothetical protein